MSNLDVHDYHLARILLVIDAFSRDGGELDGLTKLAKLDFLLRYPVFLEHLLERKRKPWPEGLAPSRAERRAVESRMMRYKYGPWDSRYYALVGALVGRGLIVASRTSGHVSFAATADGHDLAARIAQTGAWAIPAARCGLLKRWFDSPGSQLKDLIYRELPEAIDRPYWTPI